MEQPANLFFNVFLKEICKVGFHQIVQACVAEIGKPSAVISCGYTGAVVDLALAHSGSCVDTFCSSQCLCSCRQEELGIAVVTCDELLVTSLTKCQTSF